MLKSQSFCRSLLHVHADVHLACVYLHKSDGTTELHTSVAEALLVAWPAMFPSFSRSEISYNCFLNTYKNYSRTEEENSPAEKKKSPAKLFMQMDPSSSCKQTDTYFKLPNFSAVLAHWICHIQTYILPVIPMHNTHSVSSSSLFLQAAMLHELCSGYTHKTWLSSTLFSWWVTWEREAVCSSELSWTGELLQKVVLKYNCQGPGPALILEQLRHL